MPSHSSLFKSPRVLITVVVTVAILLLLLIKNFVPMPVTLASFFDGVLFLLTVVFGITVIYSSQKEQKSKDEIARLTSEIQTMDAKKNEFINMAAHELRAPLTAVKGFLSMVIAGDAGPITDKTKEFLEDTAISAQRMIRLVNNMLNVSRIEDGRMMYTLSQFHLADVAKKIRAEFEIEANRKGLLLQTHVQSNLNDTIYADLDQIQEIIVNFLSNAVKYTEEGMVDIKISNSSPHVVRLEVIDTGTGVSEVEQEKLFQKFYRIEAKIGKTIGTGLGLYISKLLIEKFGGTIGVISKTGKGSTFWFELPVKIDNAKTSELLK